MDSAIEVWEGEGGAGRVPSKLVQIARHPRPLWIGIFYAITIVVVLAVVAKLN